VLCESVSSDGFDGKRGVERMTGDVLLEAVSDEGDWLPLADELQYVYDIHATWGFVIMSQDDFHGRGCLKSRITARCEVGSVL